MDDLINEIPEDTIILRENFVEILKDASKRDQDLIPTLDSINDHLENILLEIIFTHKKEHLSLQKLESNAVKEKMKMKTEANEIKEEIDKIKVKSLEIEDLKTSCDEQRDSLNIIVNDQLETLMNVVKDFHKAPELYEENNLKKEISELKVMYEMVMENLQSIECNIESMEKILYKAEDTTIMIQNLKTAQQEFNNDNFTISWLKQCEQDWIEKNKQKECSLASHKNISQLEDTIE